MNPTMQIPTRNNCTEYEKTTGGMTVGMPKCRMICPCGWSSQWHRSSYRALQEFNKHANHCDTALQITFDEKLD